MSDLEQEVERTEYFSASIGPTDPGRMNGLFNAEVNLPDHHVTLRLDVGNWPNDWDAFMHLQRLAAQVLHEFNRSFRGYAQQRSRQSEDDIPF